MKMNKKRLLFLLCVMVFTLLILPMSGYSKNKKTPVTLTVYSQTADYSGMQIGWFAKVMLKKFNVKLKIVKDEEGTFATRLKTGKLGDICIFRYDDAYLEAANKDMLLDWNQDKILSDYGTYIKKNMVKALEKNAGLTKSGKVFGFGCNVASSTDEHSAFFYQPNVRWDLYKQIGYPDVNTLEDWVDVLAQMKKICPKSDSGKETYGVSLFNDWDGDSVTLVKCTAALYGYEELGMGLYDVNSQTWQGNLDNGSMYIRCLRFYNQLYQKDLLAPDSLTQGYDGVQEDYVDGAAFFSIFKYLGSDNYNTDKHIKQGKAMYACPSNDQNTLCYGLDVYGGNKVWTIGANTQYPELCMKIINWLSTPEGRMITEYGPKGVTWDYNSSKQPYLTELGLKCMKNGKTKMPEGYTGNFKDGQNQMNCTTWSIDAKNPDSVGESYNYTNWVTYSLIEKSDVLNDWRKYTGNIDENRYLDSKKHTVVPVTSISMERRSVNLNMIWRQVASTINDYSWKAIYAASDTEFNDIVKIMQEKAIYYGYAKCCAFLQEQAANRKVAEDIILGK